MLYMATAKPAHLGSKFLLDVFRIRLIQLPLFVLVVVSQFRLLGFDEFNICCCEHHDL